MAPMRRGWDREGITNGCNGTIGRARVRCRWNCAEPSTVNAGRLRGDVSEAGAGSGAGAIGLLQRRVLRAGAGPFAYSSRALPHGREREQSDEFPQRLAPKGREVLT